jgi:hypothetical protein
MLHVLKHGLKLLALVENVRLVIVVLRLGKLAILTGDLFFVICFTVVKLMKAKFNLTFK